MKKYYSSGAMRTGSGVNFLLRDHLGSVTRVLDYNGAAVSDTLFKAWGEARYASGTAPTTMKYTGQREQAELGLYFYNARWYDAGLSRFAQADTIIPNPGNPMAWDRYMYAQNSPQKYIDPSGHASLCNNLNSDPDCNKPQKTANTRSWIEDYGIELQGKWTPKDLQALYLGLRRVGLAFARAIGGGLSPYEAFTAVYGTGMIFEHFDGECVESCLGRAVSASHIRFYEPSKNKLDARLVVHELGHAFNARVTNLSGREVAPYDDLAAKRLVDSNFPGRNDEEDGFYGIPYGWQQSKDVTDREEFADMFVGWVYGKWQHSPAGDARASWMATNMVDWLTLLTIQPTYPDGVYDPVVDVLIWEHTGTWYK